MIDCIDTRGYKFRDGVCGRLYQKYTMHPGSDTEKLLYMAELLWTSKSMGEWVGWDDAYDDLAPEEKRMYGSRAVTPWALSEIAEIDTFVSSTAHVLAGLKTMMDHDTELRRCVYEQ